MYAGGRTRVFYAAGGVLVDGAGRRGSLRVRRGTTGAPGATVLQLVAGSPRSGGRRLVAGMGASAHWWRVQPRAARRGLQERRRCSLPAACPRGGCWHDGHVRACRAQQRCFQDGGCHAFPSGDEEDADNFVDVSSSLPIDLEAKDGDASLITQEMKKEDELLEEARIKTEEEEEGRKREEAARLAFDPEARYSMLDELLMKIQLFSEFLLEKIDQITDYLVQDHWTRNLNVAAQEDLQEF
ncbi:hypothetical protein ACP70R_027834 [Stipagrostis hirtigluma subsp. patula]